MKATEDRRATRTRLALQAAFTKLLFRDGYDAISVGEIAAEANVGRSTFYQHFDSKDDVLRGGMSRFFRVFAESVANDAEPARLRDVLDHLWQNRRLGDAIFAPAPRLILTRALAALIEEQLQCTAPDEKPVAPLRLAAILLAEGQIGLVSEWLKARVRCPPESMAPAFHASTRAAARAWAELAA